MPEPRPPASAESASTGGESPQEALLRREAILEAIGFAGERLLAAADIDVAVDEVLARLGTASEVSRVYVFQQRRVDDRIRVDQLHEWVAPGIDPQIDNLDLQDMDLEEMGFSRWGRELAAGNVIAGPVASFPADEHELLESQGIRSLVVVPILHEGAWWGFMGFDDCETDRDWSPAEKDALRAAAGILGAALQRQRDEAARQEARAAKADAKRLADVAAFRREFMSAAAHELNTPLTPILLDLDFLLKGRSGELTLEQEKTLGRMRRNVGRLTSLVQDMLDASRLETGRMKFETDPTDVAQLAREVADDFRRPAGEHGIHLSFASEPVPSIASDGRRITQILTNLVSNAVKATPDHGAITVEVRPDRQGVLLAVEDTGSGLTAQERDRLFQPFVQIARTNVRKQPGTGLGLHITRLLTEGLGGEVRVHSHGAGKGSRFEVWLPKGRPAAGE